MNNLTQSMSTLRMNCKLLLLLLLLLFIINVNIAIVIGTCKNNCSISILIIVFLIVECSIIGLKSMLHRIRNNDKLNFLL